MVDDRKPIALLPSPRSSSSPLSWANALRKVIQLPPAANDSRIIIPTTEEYQQATRGFIGPQQEMSKRKRRLLLAAQAGNSSRSTTPTNRRYIVKLKDASGREKVGKVITTMEIEEWAQKNEYHILRSFRISSYVNVEREHTELIG